MGLTFRKSIRILPGIRMNINRRSVSFRVGGHGGPRRTYGSRGRRTTSMDLPGPFGYRRSSRRVGRRGTIRR
ncbi:DUF4236 domain-containing protein [Streptomyces reniochalinae]|uniref:DUF4236 domain-containing protein n=1 Tax=Streptomyces reniochalinae TaxID=2250578 RepID=A0A367EX71_9ACTN|nr:DUF4236 domain-containing protein [Streptomyces reniochalinae]RCG22242.1 DUF4236 domain-containing protein [Streptomyces reniochalinae]